MPTLYILHRSARTRWDLVFKLAKSGDAVVLIQDGVLATVRTTGDRGIENLMQRGVKIFALKADMDARTLGARPGVEAIDYDQLVELLVRYDRTFS